MTPEGKIKEKVKRLLKEFGIYYHMPVMNGMGAPTLDFDATAWGFSLVIETKAPKEYPTERQLVTMQEQSEAGAFVFVVRDDESLLYLRCYLELLQQCHAKNLQLGLRAVGPTRTTTPSRKRSRKSAQDLTSP